MLDAKNYHVNFVPFKQDYFDLKSWDLREIAHARTVGGKGIFEQGRSTRKKSKCAQIETNGGGYKKIDLDRHLPGKSCLPKR